MKNEAFRGHEYRGAGGISVNALGSAALGQPTEQAPAPAPKSWSEMSWGDRIEAQHVEEDKLAHLTGQADVSDTLHHTAVGRQADYLGLGLQSVVDELFDDADREAKNYMNGICDVLGIKGSNRQ
jgi:hypothetical protein